MLDLFAYVGPGHIWGVSEGPPFHWLGMWLVLSPLGFLVIGAARLLFALGHRIADLDPACASPRGPSR